MERMSQSPGALLLAPGRLPAGLFRGNDSPRNAGAATTFTRQHSYFLKRFRAEAIIRLARGGVTRPGQVAETQSSHPRPQPGQLGQLQGALRPKDLSSPTPRSGRSWEPGPSGVCLVNETALQRRRESDVGSW